jgi:hypothetical protein
MGVLGIGLRCRGPGTVTFGDGTGPVEKRKEKRIGKAEKERCEGDYLLCLVDYAQTSKKPGGKQKQVLFVPGDGRSELLGQL